MSVVDEWNEALGRQRAEGFEDGFAESKKQIAELERQVAVMKAAVEHYGDSNLWGCELSDVEHSGKCVQRLYLGGAKGGANGYDVADEALAKLTEETK